MSAVTERSVMDVSAEVEVETTGHPLMNFYSANRPLARRAARAVDEQGPEERTAQQVHLHPARRRRRAGDGGPE